MNDYVLVFNAGSSSLKFCVYCRPEHDAWRLEARGLVDGIGSSPRFTARNNAGEPIADEVLGAAVRDGRGALDVITSWLRSHYDGARVLGVGHRVVHGGTDFTGPCVVTPEIVEKLRAHGTSRGDVRLTLMNRARAPKPQYPPRSSRTAAYRPAEYGEFPNSSSRPPRARNRRA